MRTSGNLLLVLSIVLAISCKPHKDGPGAYDPRLERPYCNDPSAVNYNWDFPGTPDSTVCYFPADRLSGRYMLMDSVFFPDNSLDSENIRTVYFNLYALSKSGVGMVGFCNDTDTLKFTSDRYLRALADTLFTAGQFFCSTADTFTGYMQPPMNDPGSLYIDFTVITDSASGGLKYHRGTAIKQ